MKFTIDKKKELTIFKLMESRLDATIAPDLKSEFVLLIEAEGKKYIIVDISQVEAIDSSGIGALLMAHRQTADNEGFAAFVGVKNRVKDLLKMTGLDKQLFIFSSMQEALNSIETVDSDEDEKKSTKKRSSTRKSKKKKTTEDHLEDDDLIDDIPELAGADIELEEISFEDEFDSEEEADIEVSEKKQPESKPKKTTTKKSAASKSRKKS